MEVAGPRVVSAVSAGIISGAIDMHVHSAPDVRPRKLDDWELLERASGAGMRGIVLKNHSSPTADRAQLLRSRFPGLCVFGSIVLNQSIGGLNRSAVEVALSLGAKVVWMPTISAAHHVQLVGGRADGPGIRIAVGGRLVPEVAGILELIASAGAVLATGHISPDESVTLVAAAQRAGVNRIVITHPASYLVGMPVEEQVLLARQGAFIEVAYVTTRQARPVPIGELVRQARAAGPSAVVLTSDLGQPENDYPADGLRQLIADMQAGGFSEDELRTMVQRNPAKLLDIAA